MYRGLIKISVNGIIFEEEWKIIMNMKKLFTIFTLFFIFLLPASLLAQNNEATTNIVRSFETGNAEKLSQFFIDNVELVILKTDNFYTKQQAKGIVATFFRKNPVINFDVIHKGTKENATFIIGTLVSSKGNFRITVFARKTGSQILIYQLRIEDPNE
jgi:hypothetical protein